MLAENVFVCDVLRHAAHSGFYENALYKFTFTYYLLTYLLDVLASFNITGSKSRLTVPACYTADIVTFRRPFDGYSTAYQRSPRSQRRYPLGAVTMTYLII